MSTKGEKMNLFKDTIIYDCEIKRCIPQKGKINNPSLQFCQGWTDYIGMGISVICVYEFNTDTMHTLLPDNPLHRAGLQYLLTNNLAVGFNNNRFDNNLLNAYGFVIPDSYDIFEEIKKIRGQYPKGYKLDQIAQANNLTGKAESEGGALAPVLYQRGEIERLYKYCQQDVVMTREVYKLVLEGKLVDPMHKSDILSLAKPAHAY